MLDERVHRVWIVDDERRPTGVVAMGDVIALYDKRDKHTH